MTWGLWTGKGWARMIVLILAIMEAIFNLVALPFTFGLSIIGLIIEIVIIYYLTRRHVKEYFTKAPG